MRFILLLIISLSPLLAIANENAGEKRDDLPFGRHLLANVEAPDSADVTRLNHKAFWRATAETAGMNIALWTFDRYVLKGYYAYISIHTIKNNLKNGFEWDNDHLHENMFAHPYNGALFFNAGRSNGYNFWQSSLFSLGGSAMWELFMENVPPSINDIIATPIGGSALGEVLYRTSDAVIDDRATGNERFGRELAAFVIDPMRGFTRIVTGRAWQHRATSGRRFGMPPISLDLEVGGKVLANRDNDKVTRAGITLGLNMEYGFKFENSKAPFDYFSIRADLQGIRTQPIISNADLTGRIISRTLESGKNLDASIGLFQHFDYFDSDTINNRVTDENSLLSPCVVPYKLAAPASFGVGGLLQYKPSNNFILDGYAHANAVLLGGTLTEFYRDYHRNYNYGSGFSVKAGVKGSFFNNKVILDVANQFYNLYTWRGYDMYFDWSTTPAGKPVSVQGDESSAIFNHLEGSVKIKLHKRLYLKGAVDFYWRHTNYKFTVLQGDASHFNPIVSSRQIATRLMLSYSI